MGLDPKKPIVMVAAHIFRDAPHAYPNTIFRDYGNMVIRDMY